MTTLAIDRRRVAVLFVAEGSEYLSMPVDCYDARRDARTFRGPGPVVAHPPCRLWSMLRHWSTAPDSERALALFALEVVRRNGGVLEHPAWSKLWDAAALPLPGEAADSFGGWTLAVSQKWWGHRARKRTWLYIVGCKPGDVPALPIHMRPHQAVCGGPGARAGAARLGDRERNHTPRAFAWWLEELASRCERPAACEPERASIAECERAPAGVPESRARAEAEPSSRPNPERGAGVQAERRARLGTERAAATAHEHFA
jgi:hypothetical protein